MDELATALRRERWLLNVMLFRLTELGHLLTANDSRFLGWASAEVEEAVTRVREAELIRSVLVARLARELELRPGDLTLSALTQVAPEPYRHIFADHRAAFLDLVHELKSVAETNRQLASHGIADLDDVLSKLHDDVDIAAELDIQLAQGGYQLALAAAERLSLRSLDDCLR